MDQPVLSLIKKFSKIFQVAKKELLMEIYAESLNRQYVSIHILPRSEFVMLLIKIYQCFLNG